MGDGVWGNRDAGDLIHGTPGAGLSIALERLGRARGSQPAGAPHHNEPKRLWLPERARREQEQREQRQREQEQREQLQREQEQREREQRTQEQRERERREREQREQKQRERQREQEQRQQEQREQERAAEEAAGRERQRLEAERQERNQIYRAALANLKEAPDLLKHHQAGRVPLAQVLRWQERDRVAGPAMVVLCIVLTLSTCVISVLIANSGAVGPGIIVLLTFAPLWAPLLFMGLMVAVTHVFERRRRRSYRLGDLRVSDDELVNEYISNLDRRDR
ncbi:hypothetical protein ACFQ58_08780 [Agromyces sp. NPDC056523]|uniref:hypothetical protein n=1 Tax=Agromyces sp. NPDC056523 TaxID=3345850 RepID=UPI00366E2E48